jgi:hypothetical protein
MSRDVLAAEATIRVDLVSVVQRRGWLGGVTGCVANRLPLIRVLLPRHRSLGAGPWR